MASALKKSLDAPDERIQVEGIAADIVQVGDAAISRNTFQPGAHCALGGKRVSGNQRANQSCQAHHTGVLTEGQLHIEMDDGSTLDLGPNDVFDIPPGHDGWAIGDVPMRGINWSGVRTWIPEPEAGERVLASVLFSDIVGSTELASRVGDDGWRELLGRHNREVEISSIDSAVGRSIRRATVFSPSSTVPRASTPPRRSATGCGPLGSRSDRASTGEVELIADDVRGIVVHEAAPDRGSRI